MFSSAIWPSTAIFSTTIPSRGALMVSVSFTFFEALHQAGVNVDMISTSEIRISVVTDADKLNDAVRAIHTAFNLDTEVEATVYGGTGR